MLVMRLVLPLVCGLLCAPILMAGDARLLRFPDIHKDRVVFVYAGDIYIASTSGGQATRLTSHKGRELFPKFSPDGQHIAFSAEYNGTRQVYVMPVTGGSPTQLTWYNDVGAMPPRGGFDYRILDWTPDGKHVLFRGNRLPWGVRMGRYYTVPVAGGFEQALAIPEGGGGMFSPDGKKMVYTPIDREFRTWKRHRGGRAQDVWIYDLEANSSQQITTNIMTDNQPVWVDNAIYFTSDRNFTLNLFQYDLTSKQLRQVTNHDTFDCLWLSAGPEAVVYENGGYLWTLNHKSGANQQLSIQISGDFSETLPRVENVSDYLESGDLSPNAVRAIAAARGDLFSIPVEKGQIRNITQTQGIREKDPSWSPDGKHIAYLSDEPGDYELFVRLADGTGKPRQLTKNSNSWMFAPVWSPDSSMLAWADHSQRLQIMNVASGKITQVFKTTRGSATDYDWSPDSKWIAYSQPVENGFNVLHAYNVATGKSHQLTSESTNNYDPTFGRDGKYLYFFSDRDYSLTFSSYEFTYLYNNSARLYAATLSDSIPTPFLPENEEETVEEAPKEEEAADKKAKKGKKKDKESGKTASKTDKDKPAFQPEGFEQRIFVLPPRAGSFDSLSASKKGPVFVRSDQNGRALMMVDMKKKKTTTIMKRIGGYSLAANGEKLLYFTGRKFGVASVAPDQKGKNFDLDTLTMRIDPKAEWRQIYNDAAQMVRDWFYDPNMHGFDWDALVERYRPLVDHVASRADLDYILGELGGELNAGHYYVNAGDQPSVERIDGGLLGAEMVADPSGRYRIAKIFEGENWHPNFRSPLDAVGVDAKEGDFILAIDGMEITTAMNFYAGLEGKGNQVVVLTVNSKPDMKGAREVRVKTITREKDLRYLDWVASRRAYVEKASGGRVGYIHLPNTAFEGNRELFKGFYAQVHKDALIFDDRYNGGGFIPGPMIRLLERPIFSYWAQRGIEPFRTEQYAHEGPKACLINGYSSSGGDAFPYYFRQRNLGKLFGTRTWGGLIGLQGNPGFVDGGSLSIPRFRFFTAEGEWDVENVGVAPDVEVVDRPELVAAGKDPSLEAAVAHLLEELKTKAPKKPKTPTPPNENNKP